MKDKSIKKNYIFNAGYQVVALIVPLITTPYISRVLGASNIGIHSYTYSIVSYFTLISAFGTATYATRMLGINRDNKEERTNKFWEVFFLRLLLSTVSLTLYLIYVGLFAENKMIAALQAIHIVGVAVDVAWFFQGMEEFKLIAVRNFVIKALNIAFIFIFVKDQGDLWLYVFGLSFWTLLANAALWSSLRKYLGRLNIHEIHPFSDLSIIFQLFVPTVATQIYAILDRSMIGWLSGIPEENGYYEQADKIVKMCLMLITALGTVTIPKISREYSRGNNETVQQLIYRSYRFVWFLGIAMMMGLIGINQKLVPIFFGQGYEKITLLLPILSTLFVIMGLNNAAGVQYLVSTGRQKIYMYIVVIGGFVNFIFNAILIPQYGSVGAAFGSVAGEIVILIVEFVYIVKNKSFSVSRILISSKNYAISGICMYFALHFTENVFPDSLLGLLVYIALGECVYVLVLATLRDTFIMQGIQIIIGRIKHTKG